MSMMLIARAVLGMTGLWHGAAAWHFLFYPERTLRRATSERPVNGIAVELFRFLGGLNATLAIFSGLLMALTLSSVWIALLGFSLINFSQFAVDLRVKRLGLSHGPMFHMILWGDGFFFVLNAITALYCYFGT